MVHYRPQLMATNTVPATTVSVLYKVRYFRCNSRCPNARILPHNFTFVGRRGLRRIFSVASCSSSVTNDARRMRSKTAALLTRTIPQESVPAPEQATAIKVAMVLRMAASSKGGQRPLHVAFNGG